MSSTLYDMKCKEDNMFLQIFQVYVHLYVTFRKSQVFKIYQNEQKQKTKQKQKREKIKEKKEYKKGRHVS